MTELHDDDICVHEVTTEVMRNPLGTGMPLMRLTVHGHRLDDNEHKATDLFSLVMNVPQAAVQASRILDRTADVDPVTQAIIAMALMRELETPIDTENAPDTEAYDNKEDAKPRGVKATHPADEPVNLLYGMGNPDDRPTMAPVDNRSEYPGMDGYL